MPDTIRCSRCQMSLPPEAFAPSQRKPGAWCRECRRIYMLAYLDARKPHREPKVLRTDWIPLPPRVLVTHGGKPSGTRWRQLQEQVWATETHCGFCDEYVDQTLHHNEAMARCVDHIIPIALGGAMYERDNVRLAHRRCNSVAGARMSSERVALARAAIWLASVL